MKRIVEALLKHLVSREFYQYVVWRCLMLWEMLVRRENWLELSRTLLVGERHRFLRELKRKKLKGFDKRRRER